MKVRLLVGSVLVCAGVTLVADGGDQRASQPAPRLVTITVGDPVGEKMEYSRKQIVAKPGERLRVVVTSIGQLPKVAMAHNFVLLKLGNDPKAFSDAAASASNTDYIPPSLRQQVIASTGLVGPGERSETTFTVPKAPGVYPYLCTFPGHYAAGMRGELVVK
jgi:azurin